MPLSLSPRALSTPENTPRDGSTPPQAEPATKKRKATSTSRGVASLTSGQLAKKRANDREAQRAIRERTKAQIETLERRIEELTSQRPYQELQNALRQRDAVQAENEDIRRRLGSVIAILQPLLGAQGLAEFGSATQQSLRQLSPTRAGYEQDHFQPPTSTRLMNESVATLSTIPPIHSGGYQGPYPDGIAPLSHEQTWQSSRHGLDVQRDRLRQSLELNDTERLSFNFLLDDSKRPPTIPPREDNSSPSGTPFYPSTSCPLSHSVDPPWTKLPKNIAPTCPLDTILLNFLNSRQQDRGHHTTPFYPSLSSLLNFSTTSTIDPVSRLMADIISKFPGISSLPEQVATLFLMFILMRWMINPTQQNYVRIPDWYQPTATQVFTPHPIWIDYIPWPRMRDVVIADHPNYPFENWFIPFTSGMKLDWPYEPTDCLLSAPNRDGDDGPIINPVFERHLMRLENWSVSSSLMETFPTLRGTACERKEAEASGEQS